MVQQRSARRSVSEVLSRSAQPCGSMRSSSAVGRNWIADIPLIKTALFNICSTDLACTYPTTISAGRTSRTERRRRDTTTHFHTPGRTTPGTSTPRTRHPALRHRSFGTTTPQAVTAHDGRCLLRKLLGGPAAGAAPVYVGQLATGPLSTETATASAAKAERPHKRILTERPEFQFSRNGGRCSGRCRAHWLTAATPRTLRAWSASCGPKPPGVGMDGRRVDAVGGQFVGVSDEPLLDAVVVGFEMELRARTAGP